MSEGLQAILNDEGVFEEYDDTYDLTIHCESAEEQEDVLNKLNWRWIPVSERLPEEDGCYLVTTTGTNNDIIDIAYYTDGIWHKASRIKAWMPLPDPYNASPTKAESEERDEDND